MTDLEAINIIKNEMKCVRRADKCGRDCEKCELVRPDTEILEAYTMAINAISANKTEKAWW